MRSCAIKGCEEQHLARGWCQMHYTRHRRNGDPLKRLRRAPGEGGRHSAGYFVFQSGIHKPLYRHVLVAESALGKALPPGARVHHVDANTSNDANNNLVICESHSYHLLLHRRLRALRACGHADWRKCVLCKQYDAPGDLTTNKWGHVYHAPCPNPRRVTRRAT